MIASLSSVDFAVLGEEEMLPGKIDFYNILKKLKPHIFVLNNNDSAIKEKRELCKKLGIKLKLVKRTVPKFLEAISSTDIIKKLTNYNENNLYITPY